MGPDTSGGIARAGLPPRTRLFVEDVSQEEDDNAEGNEGCPPGQQEHDHHRDGGPEERGPLAVIPKGGSPACTQTQTVAAAGTGSRTGSPPPHGTAWHGTAQPTWGVGDGGVEAAEVDEGVGAEEEVGDDGGDGVELGCGEEEEEESELVVGTKSPGWRRAPGGRHAPTDEDEANGDDVGEHVAADGLAVPPVALPEKAYERVELVLAETLWGETCWGLQTLPGTWDGSAVVRLAPVRARTKLASCLCILLAPRGAAGGHKAPRR